MEFFQHSPSSSSHPQSHELPTNPPCIDQDDNDIYRGQQPESHSVHSRPASLTSNSSLSSSSAASGHLGAVAAVVELAISRWARGNASSSSLSSSSPSSNSFISTPSRPARRRRGRRPSAVDHNARSERDILARLKARRETRKIPREFVLYIPPVLQVSLPAASRRDRGLIVENGMLRTYLLPTILNRLNATLKASARLRQRDRVRSSKAPEMTPVPSSSQPESTNNQRPSFTDVHEFHRAIKGKEKDSGNFKPFGAINPLDATNGNKGQQPAWWLDVSSPTGEDMRALGKLLHLHPLTLEDILSRDPREKLELFPKLGYYFVVFKTIESEKTREKLPRSARKEDSLPLADGIVGEDLVYLVVLRGGEGLCTFHFTDITEHLDHVRAKVLLMDETVNKSSDWIAHGILDSVVDSFFPFLTEIDKEMGQIEDVVHSNDVGRPEQQKLSTPPEKVFEMSSSIREKANYSGDLALNEKVATSSVNTRSVKTRFRLPSATIRIHLRRIKRAFDLRWARVFTRSAKKPTQVSLATLTVHRIARTRRLVTSLTRLLATKADLIAQIRKRLLTKGEWTLGSDPELYIHLGDILDHILTLQQGLAHYERILMHSQPAYLSSLHLFASKTKTSSDMAVVILSCVSIGVILLQTLIGIFSMNVTLPHNVQEPGYPLNLFGVVIAIAVVLVSMFLSFVRYLWVHAKGKRGRVL